MAEILKTYGLRKQYQMGEVTVDALCGVDFAVWKGEFVAIVETSGVGKPTLLHLLVDGSDTSGDGDVTLDGRRLAYLSDDSER
jgi:putative ABC transport system ATP-binding protein